MDLPLNGFVSDGDRGMEVGVLTEELPVIRFVIWEFRVIWGAGRMSRVIEGFLIDGAHTPKYP
jgi:hypothetical protein